MRKTILGTLISVSLVGAAIIPAIPAMADTPATLDHVQITPASVTLTPGATQQFATQGYDADSNPISTGVSYFWPPVTLGAGSINSTGFFTAGTTAGIFNGAVSVVAYQRGVSKVASANVTVTTTGILDHIVVTPATVTLLPGGTQQFFAEARDTSEAVISGLTFSWSAASSAGIINTTGFFTAGTANGTFTNAIQVSATKDQITKTANASVIIGTTPPAPVLSGYIQKMATVLGSFFNKIGFDRLISLQLQVKNGSGIETVRIIPGTVQAVSGSSLTVLPNGQTANTTFTLESSTVIVPDGSQLAVNDKVLVVTVNDKVVVVVKIVATDNDYEDKDDEREGNSGSMPPGLNKKDEDKREGKQTPPGWSKGKKVGWSKNHFGSEAGSEDDD